MTYYVGDTIEISAAASDFDGNEVTEATGSARLSIMEIGGSTVPVDSVEMPGFVFLWDTTGVAAGGYRAQVEVDVGGRKSIEVRPLILAAPDPD